jgi:hypothetical protein
VRRIRDDIRVRVEALLSELMVMVESERAG